MMPLEAALPVQIRIISWSLPKLANSSSQLCDINKNLVRGLLNQAHRIIKLICCLFFIILRRTTYESNEYSSLSFVVVIEEREVNCL